MLMKTQTTVTGDTIELVNRKLIETAKSACRRGWELQDLAKREGFNVDDLQIHHTVDEILDIIHDLNGVPQEQKDVFSRDDWDNDFLEYFSGDISLDGCVKKYLKRVAAYNLLLKVMRGD